MSAQEGPAFNGDDQPAVAPYYKYHFLPCPFIRLIQDEIHVMKSGQPQNLAHLTRGLAASHNMIG